MTKLHIFIVMTGMPMGFALFGSSIGNNWGFWGAAIGAGIGALIGIVVAVSEVKKHI